jgi:Uma2 family endonuclease
MRLNMTTKTLISCEEFERLALAGQLPPNVELIDGEVVEMAPAGGEHSFVSGQIYSILREHVEPRKIGYVLTNETGIYIRSELPRTRGADVLFISRKRLPKGKLPKGFFHVAPELVAEVISDPWSVMEEKIKDYHATGVDMVWVADPKTRTVKKFPRNGKPEIVHDGSDIDGGKILPGFKVPVARFFDED